MQRKHIIAAALSVAVAAALGVAAFAGTGIARPGPVQKDRAIDATERAALVESAIALLDRSYVYPDKAAAVAVSLRAKLHEGAFASIDSAEAFADALTDALQRDTQDRHLEVRYVEQSVPDQPSGQGGEERVARLGGAFFACRRRERNVDDLGDYRPGQGAARQHKVNAPLVDGPPAID